MSLPSDRYHLRRSWTLGSKLEWLKSHVDVRCCAGQKVVVLVLHYWAISGEESAVFPTFITAFKTSLSSPRPFLGSSQTFEGASVMLNRVNMVPRLRNLFICSTFVTIEFLKDPKAGQERSEKVQN